MWDLVGNPEDRFSHNEALLFSDVAPYLDHLRGASSTEEKEKALCGILDVFLDPKNGKTGSGTTTRLVQNYAKFL